MSFRPSPRFRVLALAALLAAVSGAAEARPAFVGHRAVYDMHLTDRAQTSDIGGASGRLVYEFVGSTCEGWTSRLRMVTRLDPVEGVSRVTDLRTATFEDDPGETFDFLNENWVDGLKVDGVKGRATRDGTGLHVRLAGADGATATLPAAALFPTAHLRAIVEAAEAGRRFVDVDLYDGSESGTRQVRTSVVIGREETGPDDTAGEPAAASDLLKSHRRWPVEISFFDLGKAKEGEATPDYQLSFLLYDNGVSRKMRFDYGSFVLSGDLSSLEALPAAACR